MQPHTEGDPGGVLPDHREEIFISTSSAAMRAVHRTIEDIANTNVPVMLVGEVGTGKLTLARYIHRRSRHRHEPFTKVDCVEVSADLFRTVVAESPNTRDRWLGLGTILLHRVEELDIAHQATLLQTLSANQASASTTRARVISSTRTNLQQNVHDGCFREDLYYSLTGVCLNLPALRYRQDDIPGLVDFFLTNFSELQNRPKPHVRSATMRALLDYSWPGNVRELESTIQKLVTLGDESRLLTELRSRGINQGNSNKKVLPLKQVARSASRQAERELILQVLSRTHWNRKRAAEELQISYKALLYKLKQIELDSAVSES